MKGSIRFIFGLLIVFGAVGGMDNGSDVFACSLLAAAGLLSMYSGVKAMENI